MTLKTLINKITAQQDSWNPETLEIFNELWKRMEGAETELEVFELRLKKQWTNGSNLYTEAEMKKIKNEASPKPSHFDSLSPLEQMT
jgi:hypothetical protein